MTRRLSADHLVWLSYGLYWGAGLALVIGLVEHLDWRIDLAAVVALPIVWAGCHLGREISEGQAWKRISKKPAAPVDDDDWESA
jgi:hypothetical protein